MVRLFPPAIFLGFIVVTASFAQSRAQLVFGSEYSCNNGQTRFIVRSCKPMYTFETCDVQYLNAAAPNGLGAQTDVRRETLEAGLNGCTVKGKPVAETPAFAGELAQAQWLGAWYDVRILEQNEGKVKVRFSSGQEDWMDASRVRRNTSAVPPNRIGNAGSANLRDGRYACVSWIGNRAVTLGFLEIKGHTYRGPSQNPTGAFAPFTVSADGAVQWSRGFGQFDSNGSHYQSATIQAGDKPRLSVRYTLPSGRAEGADCGIE